MQFTQKWKPGPKVPNQNPQKSEFVATNVKENNDKNDIGVYNEKISSMQLYKQTDEQVNDDSKRNWEKVLSDVKIGQIPVYNAT